MTLAPRAAIGFLALSTAACGLGCSKSSTKPDPTPSICSINPATAAFGGVAVGSFRDTSITITNLGMTVLSGALTVSQQGASFSLVGSGAYSLNAGQSDTFTVRFEPTGPGDFSCTVGTDPATCQMTCSGTAFVMSMAWTQVNPTGTPPSPRYLHTAIYDPVRDRMVVFGGGIGGASPAPLNDVWALSLAGTPTWTELVPTGPGPSARSSHTAIYDPVRDRIVVFGGFDVSGRLNDVWVLSLAGSPAWEQLAPTGGPPAVRNLHSAVYDPVSDRMVVFGGLAVGGNYRDVWALSLAGSPAWTNVTPAGTTPTARFFHTAIYDAARGRMVLFAGFDGTDLNDAWSLSLAGSPAWTNMTPAGTSPSPRSSPTAVYDSALDRMTLFGGYDSNTRIPRADVWALSLTGSPTWTQIIPAGSPPGARWGHTAIYDPVRGRLVLFGGFDGSVNYLNDVWALE